MNLPQISLETLVNLKIESKICASKKFDSL